MILQRCEKERWKVEKERGLQRQMAKTDKRYDWDHNKKQMQEIVEESAALKINSPTQSLNEALNVKQHRLTDIPSILFLCVELSSQC